MANLFFGTNHMNGIVDVSVRAQYRAQVGRAGFAGCATAEGDDDVEHAGRSCHNLL
jgi:hypothetical protein